MPEGNELAGYAKDQSFGFRLDLKAEEGLFLDGRSKVSHIVRYREEVADHTNADTYSLLLDVRSKSATSLLCHCSHKLRF